MQRAFPGLRDGDSERAERGRRGEGWEVSRSGGIMPNKLLIVG